MLEIKTYFSDWKETTKEQAEAFYKTFYNGSTAIKIDDKHKYFNEHHIRGGHVLLSGKVETTEEQRERIFNSTKKELIKGGFTRFIVIEYVCGFSKIDPYIMASALIKEGVKIVFDDSTISGEDNKKKERKVFKLNRGA